MKKVIDVFYLLAVLTLTAYFVYSLISQIKHNAVREEIDEIELKIKKHLYETLKDNTEEKPQTVDIPSNDITITNREP